MQSVERIGYRVRCGRKHGPFDVRPTRYRALKWLLCREDLPMGPASPKQKNRISVEGISMIRIWRLQAAI